MSQLLAGTTSTNDLEANGLLRPTTTAPKPNVRFLKNIIRDTDTHNAALKAREVADADRRLGKAQVGLSLDPGTLARKIGGRAGRLESEVGSRKRRRLDSPSGHDEQRRLDRLSNGSHRARADPPRTAEGNMQRLAGNLLKSLNRIPSQSQHERHPGEDRNDRGDETRVRKRKHHSPHRSSSRSRHHHRKRRSNDADSRDDSVSAESDGGRRNSKHRRRKDRSTSPSSKSTARTAPQKSAISSSVQADSDSDPLEAIVGPLPPPKVQRRGRGTTAASAMDARFDSSYNPAMDVRPNSDSEDDWDQALEALHDRTRWKQQGAERLRAAGFTDDEINKWEKGGAGRAEDVRWKGRGESREWDRGKTLDADGVRLEVDWARLK